MPFLVDSNVFLDVFTQDSEWRKWSLERLESAAASSMIILNAVIYAEISIRFESTDDLDLLLPPEVFEFRPITREMAFWAGKCYRQYRKGGGLKVSPLPDFFIGAHAAVERIPLITRDPKRVRRYFPSVEVIAP